jgi:hypothetical protein
VVVGQDHLDPAQPAVAVIFWLVRHRVAALRDEVAASETEEKVKTHHDA